MSRWRIIRRRPGFTLIEMVAVLAIVGLLAAMAAPMLELTARRAHELALRQALRELRTAIDAYKAAADGGRIVRPEGTTGSGYPETLDVLVRGAPLADGSGQPLPGARLYLLRRLPRDPFAEPGLPAAETWGLRASDTPPDAPAPGKDVFDVFSRSDRVALDGTRYSEW
jgi:general secretion pathway protein G